VVVDDAYRRAARVLSPDIARTYTELRAKRNQDAEDDFEAALLEAREDVAAIGLLENLQIAYDAEAMRATDEWLAKYKDKIKKLTDDRQEVYRSISAFSRKPQDVDLAQPKSWIEATTLRDTEGKESAIPAHEHHLLCDEQRLFPAKLNGWETATLEAEVKRNGFKLWYRNPKQPSQDSLGIAYQDGDEVKIVRPDFLFFSEISGKGLVVDIVDPHGTHLSDSLPKLKGMAIYAERHAADYRRVEVIAEVNGKLRMLNLTDAAVRGGVMAAANAKELFEGPLAKDYK